VLSIEAEEVFIDGRFIQERVPDDVGVIVCCEEILEVVGVVGVGAVSRDL
jgi:hypothetical protein